METHEWVSVALLSGYTVFRTAVNNINIRHLLFYHQVSIFLTPYRTI
jgi:hypothetical protein